MSTSRKYYFSGKGGGPPKMAYSRQRSKSSELFDEVLTSEPSEVEAPPPQTGGVNTTWAPSGKSGSGGKVKKKELRSDDKISYRGAVYKCSPFCPSPVKASSQPESNVLASMVGGSDQSMDTEDVFETKHSVHTSTDIPGGQGGGKSRRMLENLKVFDFDFDGEEKKDVASVKAVKAAATNSDKIAPKPAASNRRYTTIRDLGTKKKSSVSSRMARAVRRPKDHLEGGAKTGGQGAEKSGGGGGGGIVGVVYDTGRWLDKVGAVQEDKKEELVDERKTEVSRIAEEKLVSASVSKKPIPSHVNKSLKSDSTDGIGSNVRVAGSGSNVRLAKKPEQVDVKQTVSMVSDLLQEAGSSRVNSKVANGNNSGHSETLADKNGKLISYQNSIPLEDSPSSLSLVVSISNLRRFKRKATAQVKRRAESSQLMEANLPQPKHHPPSSNVRNAEKKNGADGENLPFPEEVHGFQVEDGEDRVNGVWSLAAPSKVRVGKRKRAWLIHQDVKESDNSDPYAFDIADDTAVESLAVPGEKGSSDVTSKLRPLEDSRKLKRALRKKSEELDSDMLREIDAMLEGYEERKEEQEDVASRLSPSNGSSDGVPTVGRLKKSMSEVGRGKARKYAYTARPGPSTGEVGGAVPRMKKALTWPRRPRTEANQGKTVSPVLSTGHARCMEAGETRQFFEEIHYLLDSMKPCRPLHTRCLSTCSLASQFLDLDFSRQVRAHDFTEKIISVLQDSLQHHSLGVCAAVLLYVMTRDKMCTNLGEGGVTLLVNMLGMPTSPEEELEGREAKDWEKVQEQARSVLDQVADRTSQGINTPPPEEEEEEELLPLSQPTSSQDVDKTKSDKKRPGFRVATEEISVPELARECVISLSAPQNDPQQLREELRIRGALDHLANMVIHSCEELGSVDCSRPEDLSNEVVMTVAQQAGVLDRQLKCIEHLTLMNRSNQSYLVIFDGSLLVSRLSQFLAVGHQWLYHSPLRYSGLQCLLAVLKLLINLTHESDLGCHRVGEQKDIMAAILRIILKCPDSVPESDKFDISIMALCLIINLIERSTANCHLLESVSVDNLIGQNFELKPSQASIDVRCNGGVAPRGSVLRALVQLFLKLTEKADSAVIEVPTPQRLSQISSTSPHSSADDHSSQETSPEKMSGQRGGAASCKTDLSGRLSGNVKGYSTSENLTASRKWHQKVHHPLGTSTRAGKVSSTRAGKVSMAADDEEECEPIEMDTLVFDRDEFNCALDQAGRQMEDSIFSSYLALVLGIVAEKDFDMVDVIRNLMPSGTFSEMLKMLKQFVSFMSMTGSDIGLESVRHTIKYLEAL